MVMKYFLGSSFDETLNSLDNNFNKINVFKIGFFVLFLIFYEIWGLYFFILIGISREGKFFGLVVFWKKVLRIFFNNLEILIIYYINN